MTTHAFRLGPLPSSGGEPKYAYVGLAEDGEPLIHEAPTDRGGLEVLQARSVGGPLVCEPALAEAGKSLGLESAPLPPSVRKVRACLAYELASGVEHGGSKPDAIAAFLGGAAAFWAARSWEVAGPEERLRVTFLEGHGEVDGELSVVGGDGTRLPGVALCDARGALGELSKLEGSARAEAALRLANLTVDMERDPAWAAEAIEEGYGLPRVPVATRRRDGAAGPMVTQDLLVGAALLEAIAAWTGLDDEAAAGKGQAEAAGMRVMARVQVSERPPSSPAGLTPAAEAPVEAKAETEPAATKAETEPTATKAETEPTATKAEAKDTLAAEPTPAGRVAPVAPADAAPAPPPKSASRGVRVAMPERSGPAPSAPGWLTRVWRSLRGEGASAPHPAAPSKNLQPHRAPPSAPAAAPEPAIDESSPFAPFARALRIEIPAEPPVPSPGDAAALAELAARVVLAAKAAKTELASFPAVALEIVERVHDPKADARGVAGYIARDPALAADVVSVANSAAFRGVSEVESVHEAVARLGLVEVGRIASAVAARKLLDPPGGEVGSRGKVLFLRAVAVATAAAGAALRQRGARTDHVWLGGLLHDVGKVLSLQILARLVTEPGAHLTPIALADRLIEQVHVEVGEAATQQWALPAYLREICAHHHDPIVPAEAADLHLVRLVSALAGLSDPAVAARAAREIIQSAGALRMDPAAVRALAADLKLAEGRARTLVR
ncbi:MAG TPA: HDOD domain-containing protein [Anaeromyxobacter sp.]|nr:HDOD domain-containing protein [Anaeromyxobacter sp.]